MSNTAVITTQTNFDGNVGEKFQKLMNELKETRFPGEGNKLSCGECVYDSCDEWEQDGEECPICCRCNCGSQECELEIERQEFYAEYWADF